MKRKCVIHPVKASSSSSQFNAAKVSRLFNTLKTAYDQLESMDADTYEAVDGANMQKDLDTYIRELSNVVRPV